MLLLSLPLYLPLKKLVHTCIADCFSTIKVKIKTTQEESVNEVSFRMSRNVSRLLLQHEKNELPVMQCQHFS
jgi:hypothetical protein